MDIDLCNAALTVMGLDPIADPARPRGRVETACVTQHLAIRRQVLEGSNWTACEKAAKLNPEAGGIVPPGFAYVALLPDDYLGLWRASATNFSIVLVGDGAGARRRIAWDGDATIIIVYSADIPYVLMNPLLQKAARDALIAVLAPVNSEKMAERKAHADLAVASEMQCASRDALNRRQEPLFANGWDTANAGMEYGDPNLPRAGRW